MRLLTVFSWRAEKLGKTADYAPFFNLSRLLIADTAPDSRSGQHLTTQKV